jgi:hypothetical protein
MEGNIVGFVALAAGLIIGLGAAAPVSASASWAAVFSKLPPVSPS